MRVNDTLPRIEEDIGSLLEEELEGVEGDRERFEALKTSVTSSGFEVCFISCLKLFETCSWAVMGRTAEYSMVCR